MNIIYYGNCCATNVGEAFIDIGAMSLLKKAMPEAKIIYVSPMSKYYNRELRKKKRMTGVNFMNPSLYGDGNSISNGANLAMYMKADLFVLGGMFATYNFPDLDGEYFVKPLFEKNKNLKTLFLGAGGLHYTERESQKFLSFAQNVMRPIGFISRDNTAYDLYKNDFKEVRAGIDCGFFCSDEYDPRGFSNESYDVVTFNRMKEPPLFSPWPRPIIRAEHMFYYADYKSNVENYFISDYPHEYMSLYANANEIHTDLVHGTVMGLMYNRPVKYYHDSKRSYCFDAAGAVVSDDGFLRLSPETLQKKKNEMINNVRAILLGQVE